MELCEFCNGNSVIRTENYFKCDFCGSEIRFSKETEHRLTQEECDAATTFYAEIVALKKQTLDDAGCLTAETEGQLAQMQRGYANELLNRLRSGDSPTSEELLKGGN